MAGKKRSLRIRIGILYTLLALINIIFFSVMIFENQNDLLLANFKYQTESIVKDFQAEIRDLKISPAEDDNFRRLAGSLSAHELAYFIVFDEQGQIWHRRPDGPPAPDNVNEETLQRSREIQHEELLYSRYSLELNEEDFSVQLLMPLATTGGQAAFLQLSMSIATIKDRLFQIYLQIGLAVVWGIIFHVLFAIFVFQVIFRRVTILRQASDRMSGGELEARAEWKRSGSDDELDELGDAFNTMAGSIEDQVNTITRLNSEIQEELKIGKDVQEIFLSEIDMFADFKLTLFYRPLREVSGDVYKFYNFRGERKGLFFADASGHGVSAALITTITIMSLDEILRRQVKPAGVLNHLNQALAQRLDTSFFATGVFLLFNPDGSMQYTNAGHNPMYHMPAGSTESAQLGKMGPPLGLMEEFEYPNETLQMGHGDKLVIYSDGLVETQSAGEEQFGEARLLNLLSSHAQADPVELHSVLEKEFTDFAAHYKDDVTFIILEIP